MKCKICKGKCIKNGFQTSGKQRYYCNYCQLHQQENYIYKAYLPKTNLNIIKLLVNSCGIRDISRILSISKNTVLSRIIKIAKALKWPNVYERNQVYQADELSIKMKGFNSFSIAYIINKSTRKVISFCVGSKTKENMLQMMYKVLSLYPKCIYTDKMSTYASLIPKEIHSTQKNKTNYIERFHLNIRTHLGIMIFALNLMIKKLIML